MFMFSPLDTKIWCFHFLFVFWRTSCWPGCRRMHTARYSSASRPRPQRPRLKTSSYPSSISGEKAFSGLRWERKWYGFQHFQCLNTCQSSYVTSSAGFLSGGVCRRRQHASQGGLRRSASCGAAAPVAGPLELVRHEGLLHDPPDGHSDHVCHGATRWAAALCHRKQFILFLRIYWQLKETCCAKIHILIAFVLPFWPQLLLLPVT